MCGRVNVHDHHGVQELLDHFGLRLSPARFEPRYNIAPGASILTVYNGTTADLARISHHPSRQLLHALLYLLHPCSRTADADLLAVTGRTPSSRFDVVSTMPSPSSGPCTPSQRHLDALATNGGEKCGLAMTEWGIVPPWAKPDKFSGPLFNARAETIHEKPSFKKLIKSGRCIIPVNGFYEWKGGGKAKQSFYVRPKRARALALAGIYQMTNNRTMQCCVITISANSLIRRIHNRMPVIVAPDRMEDWIYAEDTTEVDAFMVSAPDEWLQIIQVSSYVNNARNEGVKCIESITMC